jgi:hypothetical protein
VGGEAVEVGGEKAASRIFDFKGERLYGGEKEEEREQQEGGGGGGGEEGGRGGGVMRRRRKMRNIFHSKGWSRIQKMFENSSSPNQNPVLFIKLYPFPPLFSLCRSPLSSTTKLN